MGDIADSHLDDMMFDEECEFCGALDGDKHDEDCPLAEFEDLEVDADLDNDASDYDSDLDEEDEDE